MPESQTVPQLPQFIGSFRAPAVQDGTAEDVVDEGDDVVLDGIVEVVLVVSDDEVLDKADEVLLERTVEFVKGGKDEEVLGEEENVIVELVKAGRDVLEKVTVAVALKFTVTVVAGIVTVKLPPVIPMQLQALEYLTIFSQALA